MRFPWQKKALTGTPAIVESLSERSFSPYPLLGAGARQRIVDRYNTAKSANYAWMYTNSPAVRTVIDVIVENGGQMALRLYEEVAEDERHPDPDHPAALSLRYPNEGTSGDSFIRQMWKDFLVADDAFAVIEPAPGGQISLLWVPYYMVEIRGASLWRAEGYRVWHRTGESTDISTDNMFHWHGENPHDPRMGLSKLESLRDVIAEDAALQQATVELANSGLTEPAWVFRPLEAPQWSNDARRGFEEDLTNRMRRRNKTPVVLEEGMEMRSFGVSPKDAEMMAVRQWAIGRVAAEFGVPAAMVGLADNIAEARQQFVSDTLAMYCERFTRTLNHRVLVQIYDSPTYCFEFNLDEKLMGDDRIKTLVAASGRAVMTTDEARAKLNLPPIDGGDELVTPLNVMVGDNPKPSPMVNPPQDPNAPSDGGDARNPEGIPTENRRALPAAGKAEQFEPVPVLHPGFKQEIDRQHRNIDRAQAVVQRHFNRLGRSLNQKRLLLERNGEEFEAKAVDWRRWDAEFADDLERLLEDIVEKEATIYAFKLGGVFDPSRVVNYLRAMAEGAAGAINDTVRGEIADLGLDGAMANTPTHVASAGISLGGKATLWARDEAAKQSPDYEHRVKTWIPDTQRHAEFAGDTVPVGDPWPAGFAPGGAPGCRCSMSIR